MEKTVRLTIHPERDGAEVVTAKSPGRPDADGVLRTFVIEPPEFECGTYYAACQKYDIVEPPPDMWPEGAKGP